MRFSKKATQYIFFEIFPYFVLGLMVFIFIILMFQALRYTEFVLIHGVSMIEMGKILGFIVISILPALLPMSLLFAILMTYGRLSGDSEIVAFKASGLSMHSLSIPAAILSFCVALISAQTSFHLAPWGNRQFELLITKLSQSKASATIREGAFSEGFFDLVVYAHEVDNSTGKLSKIFIYDERQSDVPLTIIAKAGELNFDTEKRGNAALLRLYDGDIHRKGENHTKIKFETFDIKLSDSVQEEARAKSPPSLTIEEISAKLKTPDLSMEDRNTLKTEYHKRWALSSVCIVFAIMGVGLGTNTNRRNQKAGGMITCLFVIILYWILYVSAEGMSRSGQAPAAIAIWLPNILFLASGIHFYRKNALT
jgi:lipopolysaccharide export system permease protein